MAMALSVLSIFVVSEFAYLVELLQGSKCTQGAQACDLSGLLTSENMRQLQELRLSVGFYATFDAVVNGIFVAVWLAVGALIFWQRSDDRVALLIALFLVTFGPMSFGPWAPSFLAKEYPGLFWLPVKSLEFLGFAFMAFFLCVFPSGRFVPGWSRWLVLAFIPLIAVATFFPNALNSALFLSDLVYFVVFAFYVAFVAAQVYRYRRVSGLVERQQTKWVVFGTTAGVVGLTGMNVFAFALLPRGEGITYFYFVGWALAYCLMLLIPVSFGVAVLHSRLWEIDVVINRTLVYGSLTAILALVYFGGVTLLQRVFNSLTSQGSTLAVVASTLLIAAMFMPLRRRIQSFIDRRFYRSKYDARKTLEALSAKLRDETNLEALSVDLVGAVRETMQPAHVSLWLRPDPKQRDKRRAAIREAGHDE
jgi:hypothetical protein